MLLGGILPVFGLELELGSVLHGPAQDRDGLLVGHPGAGASRQGVQLVQQAAAGELVQELQLVRAFLQHGPDQALQEILLDVHQLVQIAEGDFRLDHPELGRVGLGVAVLRPEGGPEGIDPAEGHGEGFALQLARHRQGGGLAEEILREVRLFAQGQGRHREGVPGALRVIARDQGRMHVDISPVLKIGVNGHGRHAADAEHRLEQAGPGPEIGDLPQELQGMLLGLQGIILGAVALQRDLRRLNLRRFGIPVAGHHLSPHPHGAADPEGLDGFKIRHRAVVNHLGIPETGAVIEIDKAHVLLLPMVADPALQGHLLPLQLLQPLLQLPGGHDVHGSRLLKNQFLRQESYHIQEGFARQRDPPPGLFLPNMSFFLDKFVKFV